MIRCKRKRFFALKIFKTTPIIPPTSRQARHGLVKFHKVKCRDVALLRLIKDVESLRLYKLEKKMNIFIKKQRFCLVYRVLSAFIAVAFLTTTIVPAGYAQMVTMSAPSILNLPTPGTMVTMSEGFHPPLIRGLRIDPENPLKFNFIVETGDTPLQGTALQQEGEKLIKYFLAALTVPEEDMWVNLSPYEADRIIPEGLGDTEMGRDLLAQDYILKQLSASMMYPEDELGEEFWERVYTRAQEEFGTTDLPMNTFNKIWIVPSKAEVYEHEESASAYVVGNHLKVMLEEDYVALQENAGVEHYGLDSLGDNAEQVVSGVSSAVIREVLIPEIEKEVNTGEHFANLRQIFHSMILAEWYKQNLRQSLLGQVYVDQNKTKGVDTTDKHVNQKIYEQYIESFKKGVYDYIREDYDPTTQQIIPRKYFSGGFVMKAMLAEVAEISAENLDDSQLSILGANEFKRYDFAAMVEEATGPVIDAARLATPIQAQNLDKAQKAGASVANFLREIKDDQEMWTLYAKPEFLKDMNEVFVLLSEGGQEKVAVNAAIAQTLRYIKRLMDSSSRINEFLAPNVIVPIIKAVAEKTNLSGEKINLETYSLVINNALDQFNRILFKDFEEEAALELVKNTSKISKGVVTAIKKNLTRDEIFEGVNLVLKQHIFNVTQGKEFKATTLFADLKLAGMTEEEILENYRFIKDAVPLQSQEEVYAITMEFIEKFLNETFPSGNEALGSVEQNRSSRKDTFLLIVKLVENEVLVATDSPGWEILSKTPLGITSVNGLINTFLNRLDLTKDVNKKQYVTTDFIKDIHAVISESSTVGHVMAPADRNLLIQVFIPTVLTHLAEFLNKSDIPEKFLTREFTIPVIKAIAQKKDSQNKSLLLNTESPLLKSVLDELGRGVKDFKSEGDVSALNNEMAAIHNMIISEIENHVPSNTYSFDILKNFQVEIGQMINFKTTAVWRQIQAGMSETDISEHYWNIVKVLRTLPTPKEGEKTTFPFILNFLDKRIGQVESLANPDTQKKVAFEFIDSFLQNNGLRTQDDSAGWTTIEDSAQLASMSISDIDQAELVETAKKMKRNGGDAYEMAKLDLAELVGTIVYNFIESIKNDKLMFLVYGNGTLRKGMNEVAKVLSDGGMEKDEVGKVITTALMDLETLLESKNRIYELAMPDFILPIIKAVVNKKKANGNLFDFNAYQGAVEDIFDDLKGSLFISLKRDIVQEIGKKSLIIRDDIIEKINESESIKGITDEGVFDFDRYLFEVTEGEKLKKDAMFGDLVEAGMVEEEIMDGFRRIFGVSSKNVNKLSSVQREITTIWSVIEFMKKVFEGPETRNGFDSNSMYKKNTFSLIVELIEKGHLDYTNSKGWNILENSIKDLPSVTSLISDFLKKIDRNNASIEDEYVTSDFIFKIHQVIQKMQIETREVESRFVVNVIRGEKHSAIEKTLNQVAEFLNTPGIPGNFLKRDFIMPIVNAIASKVGEDGDSLLNNESPNEILPKVFESLLDQFGKLKNEDKVNVLNANVKFIRSDILKDIDNLTLGNLEESFSWIALNTLKAEINALVTFEKSLLWDLLKDNMKENEIRETSWEILRTLRTLPGKRNKTTFQSISEFLWDEIGAAEGFGGQAVKTAFLSIKQELEAGGLSTTKTDEGWDEVKKSVKDLALLATPLEQDEEMRDMDKAELIDTAKTMMRNGGKGYWVGLKKLEKKLSKDEAEKIAVDINTELLEESLGTNLIGGVDEEEQDFTIDFEKLIESAQRLGNLGQRSVILKARSLLGELGSKKPWSQFKKLLDVFVQLGMNNVSKSFMEEDSNVLMEDVIDTLEQEKSSFPEVAVKEWIDYWRDSVKGDESFFTEIWQEFDPYLNQVIGLTLQQKLKLYESILQEEKFKDEEELLTILLDRSEALEELIELEVKNDRTFELEPEGLKYRFEYETFDQDLTKTEELINKVTVGARKVIKDMELMGGINDDEFTIDVDFKIDKFNPSAFRLRFTYQGRLQDDDIHARFLYAAQKTVMALHPQYISKDYEFLNKENNFTNYSITFVLRSSIDDQEIKTLIQKEIALAEEVKKRDLALLVPVVVNGLRKKLLEYGEKIIKEDVKKEYGKVVRDLYIRSEVDASFNNAATLLNNFEEKQSIVNIMTTAADEIVKIITTYHSKYGQGLKEFLGTDFLMPIIEEAFKYQNKSDTNNVPENYQIIIRRIFAALESELFMPWEEDLSDEFAIHKDQIKAAIVGKISSGFDSDEENSLGVSDILGDISAIHALRKLVSLDYVKRNVAVIGVDTNTVEAVQTLLNKVEGEIDAIVPFMERVVTAMNQKITENESREVGAAPVESDLKNKHTTFAFIVDFLDANIAKDDQLEQLESITSLIESGQLLTRDDPKWDNMKDPAKDDWSNKEEEERKEDVAMKVGTAEQVKIPDTIEDMLELFDKDLIHGGINLNAAAFDLQIKRDGRGVPLPLEFQSLGDVHVEGFLPIIMNITPINLPQLLGLVIPESMPAQDAVDEANDIPDYYREEDFVARDPMEIQA